MEQKNGENSPDLTYEQFNKLYNSGKDITFGFIRFILDRLKIQEDTIKSLQAEIKDLKSQIAKDSHNSSKPPSSDGLKSREKKTRSLREKSKKKPGGQKGHKGKTLEAVDCPNKTKRHPVDRCKNCGKSLEDVQATVHDKRQVFDLPEKIEIIVTEHQAEEKDCPYCGEHNKASFPPDVTHKVQYGNHIKSIAVYLSNYELIPYKRLSELFEDIFHISISVGMLSNNNDTAGELLKEPEAKIKEKIINSEIVHFDETGCNIGGERYWMLVASTGKYTCYFPHARRGTEAMDEMGILPNFIGTAVHDHFKSYFTYNCLHALCNAHHLRELVFVYEEYDQKWAKKMIDLLLEIKKATERTKNKKLNTELIIEFEKKYNRILNAGLKANPPPEAPKEKKRGRTKKSKTRNLLERLKDFIDSVLAFMYNLKVPFDNNQGERDIRMEKVKQKISGLFRTYDGALTFCRIRGYISTVRKNGLPVLESIKAIFEKNAFALTLFKA